MARLNSIPPFLGTVDDVTIYEMYNWYYIRSRSSLTAKRVKTDPAFRNFMLRAELMKLASPLAACIYRALPAGWKRSGLFNKLVGEVTRRLKQGWQAEAIITDLFQAYTQQKKALQKPAAPRISESNKRKTQQIDGRRRQNLFGQIDKGRKAFTSTDLQYCERIFQVQSRERNKHLPSSPLFSLKRPLSSPSLLTALIPEPKSHGHHHHLHGRPKHGTDVTHFLATPVHEVVLME